jgi:enoyl-CoA hydratase
MPDIYSHAAAVPDALDRRHGLSIGRRGLLQATVVLGGAATLLRLPALAQAGGAEGGTGLAVQPDEVKMPDVPLSSAAKVTVERRGQIVLMGINRPYIHNRIDPETYMGLARAYYQYDHDPSLRTAVLFGHGENFSRGIDVDAFQALAASGRALMTEGEAIDPLPKTKARLSKPLVVVVHGDTWNMGHEIHLTADIRIAAVRHAKPNAQ